MREIQSHGQITQIDALGIKQFLVDRTVETEIMGFDRIPELRGIFFAQKHDCFAGSGAQVIGFFDAVDEEVVDVFVRIVQTD
jgi:hypothetical protein